MSVNDSSSADPSIEVVEVKLSDVMGNQSDLSSNRWRQKQQQDQQRQPLSLPPRAETRGSKKSDENISTVEAKEEEDDDDDSIMEDVVGLWRDGASKDVTDHEEEEYEKDDVDDMAERVLQTLQRKDALLAEQTISLEHREMEIVKLRQEVDELQGEKQLLMQKLRDVMDGTEHATTRTGVVNEGRSVDSSLILLRVDSQLQDERAERQQDAEYFKAHIDQLTAQLSQAQHDASARETKHAQDLEYIQREMQELSTLVDDVHSTKSALRRTQEQLAKATEAKVQCQLECDRLVRTLQEALRREESERHLQVNLVRAEAQEWQRAAAVAETKCRDVEAAQLRAAEEVVTLRLEAQHMMAEHAALTLQVEAAEQQLRCVQEQRMAERTAAHESYKQLEAQLEVALKDIEQLRSVRDAQSHLLMEENKRHASFKEEVAGCVQGTQQLEEALRRCERRCHETEERERHAADERDRLRTQLQRLTTASRQEMLDQQKLAEEMRSFHQAKLQQLQQAADRHRQRAQQLEENSRVTHNECTALRTSLENTRRQLDKATAELQKLRQEHVTLELMLREAQEAHRECEAYEHQATEQIDALRRRLQLRERARRELRAQVQRLEEREQRERLAKASESLLHISAKQQKKGLKNLSLRQESKQEEKEEDGLPLALLETDVDTSLCAKTSSTATTAPPPRGSLFDMWRARLQALESRNVNLEQQLSARLNGHRALIEDRKALQRQLYTLQATAQQQMSELERQHRDGLRRLEEVHRSRTSTLCRNMTDETERRESFVRRGIAQVVSELMAFIQALETHAASITLNCLNMKKTRADSVVNDEKENILWAACDDITRNFLGVEGGWEALLQYSLYSQAGYCHYSNSDSKGTRLITAEMRRRVQSSIVDYLETQLLTKPGATVGLSRLRRGANNKKALNVSFQTSHDNNNTNEDVDGDWKKEYQSRGEQPLVELLMECVSSVFSYSGAL